MSINSYIAKILIIIIIFYLIIMTLAKWKERETGEIMLELLFFILKHSSASFYILINKSENKFVRYKLLLHYKLEITRIICRIYKLIIIVIYDIDRINTS